MHAARVGWQQAVGAVTFADIGQRVAQGRRAVCGHERVRKAAVVHRRGGRTITKLTHQRLDVVRLQQRQITGNDDNDIGVVQSVSDGGDGGRRSPAGIRSDDDDPPARRRQRLFHPFEHRHAANVERGLVDAAHPLAATARENDPQNPTSLVGIHETAHRTGGPAWANTC